MNPVKHLVVIDRLLAIAANDDVVLPVDQSLQMLFERFRMLQIAHLNRFLHIFVAIDRADAAERRAEMILAEALLFPLILRRMNRQHHQRAIGNLQILRRNLNALFAQTADFLAQMLQIHDHARAQQVDRVAMENARRQQVQRKLAVFVHDRMTGVVAALIANDHIELIGKVIDHTTLAFVSPVDSNDCSIRHILHLIYECYSDCIE